MLGPLARRGVAADECLDRRAGHRQPKPARDPRGDADDLAKVVDQRPAGVAGSELGVGLDHVSPS